MSARSRREYQNDDMIYRNAFYIKFSTFFVNSKENFADISKLINSEDNTQDDIQEALFRLFGFFILTFDQRTQEIQTLIR